MEEAKCTLSKCALSSQGLCPLISYVILVFVFVWGYNISLIVSCCYQILLNRMIYTITNSLAPVFYSRPTVYY